MILVSEPFFIVTERCRYAWKGSRWIRNPLLSSFGIKWGWSSAAFGDEAAREVRFGVHRVSAVDLWWQNCVTLSPPIIFNPVLSWFRFTWELLKSLCLRNYVVITLMSIDPPFSTCLEVPLQVDLPPWRPGLQVKSDVCRTHYDMSLTHSSPFAA